MTTHNIKIHSSMYLDVGTHEKSAEFRKNDRDYKVGDLLVMRPVGDNDAIVKGPDLRREVTHVVYGPDFGIPEGYCMMSIK